MIQLKKTEWNRADNTNVLFNNMNSILIHNEYSDKE